MPKKTRLQLLPKLVITLVLFLVGMAVAGENATCKPSGSDPHKETPDTAIAIAIAWLKCL